MNSAVARSMFSSNGNVASLLGDGGDFLRDCREQFDLIYADAWPGKFDHLSGALALLAPGGIYVIDDLLPQPNWPDGHERNVAALLDTLASMPGYRWTPLAWSTGVGLLTKQ